MADHAGRGIAPRYCRVIARAFYDARQRSDTRRQRAAASNRNRPKCSGRKAKSPLVEATPGAAATIVKFREMHNIKWRCLTMCYTAEIYDSALAAYRQARPPSRNEARRLRYESSPEAPIKQRQEESTLAAKLCGRTTIFTRRNQCGISRTWPFLMSCHRVIEILIKSPMIY